MFSQRTHILCQFHLLVPKKAVEVVWLFQFPFHRGGDKHPQILNCLQKQDCYYFEGTCKEMEHAKPIYIESI